jgi:CO/xanthine dehydrogenase Mo-binding subunit
VETYAAVGVEVRLDRETGYVQVLRAAAAHEVGRVVNPIMYQGQIDGGLIQGLGFALTEGLQFDEGRVTTLNLHDYKLPCAADVPDVETRALPPDLSLGITPIGEGPNVAMSSAIACALMDVVGRQVDIPVSAEALVDATAAAPNSEEAATPPLALGVGWVEGTPPGHPLTRPAPSALRRPLPKAEAERGA